MRILPPLRAERCLPFDIGRDAVAVADVHRGLARQAVDRAVQRGNTPAGDLVEIDIEGRLVELDHIDPDRRQFARLLVQEVGEGHRHRDAVAVMRVGDRVDDRHRAGQGEFERTFCMSAGNPRLRAMHRALAAQRAGHGRHHRLVAVVADAHRDAAGEIDAVDAFQEAVHEVLPRQLTIADDVDAGIFLELQRQQGRVALALGERLAVQPPRRP
jgi:hypothetical protein